MDDLSYIIGLGFSGADIWRALIIAFFLAMILGRKRSVWLIAFIALFIDRIIWPIAGMALSGAELQSLYASIGAIVQTLGDDLGMYLVRYLGLTIMIAAFVETRARIHKLGPPPKKAKAAAA